MSRQASSAVATGSLVSRYQGSRPLPGRATTVSYTHLDQRTQQESQMQQVARAVKSYASRLKRQYLKVLSVSTVSRSSGRYVQAVQVAIEDEIVPTETPVDLHRRLAHMVHGRVVGQEPDGGVLYVAFDSEVLEDDLPATLAIDRAFLLHGLADSLERLDAVPRLADPLLKSSGRAITIARRESSEVASVLGALPAPWTRFLWGPPGAGKTYACLLYTSRCV